MKLKLAFISVLLLNGCGKAVVQHPGALNSFDNYAYDILRTEEEAIKALKNDITPFPNLKPALVVVIKQYDESELAYKVYHNALAAGTNPDKTALQKSIDDLISNIAALLLGMSKTPPTAPALPGH